jgi:hypothetical protein
LTITTPEFCSSAEPMKIVLLIVSSAHIHLARVHGMADGRPVEREALLRGRADIRKMRMEDPVKSGPAAEAARWPRQRLDLDIFGLLEFRDLHEISAHRRRANEEHVVFLGSVDVLQIEMRERSGGERKRHALRRAKRGRRARNHSQYVLVDLAVEHLDGRHLHDAAAVALGRKDVELGALGLVVPLDQSGWYLREAVDARRDIAVQSARHRGGAAGARDQEHCLVAFDHRFSRADAPEPGLALLELGDELLAVLDLECRVGH